MVNDYVITDHQFTKGYMLESLQNFEQSTAKSAPLVLIVPGLTAVVVGLFIWLSGLRLKRPLLGLIGAIIGAICGFLLSKGNLIATAIVTGVAALASAIFQRLIITLLLAALVAVVCFAILAAPYTKTTDAAANNDQVVITESGQTMSARESLQAVKAYAVSFGSKLKNACRQMPFYNWAIIVALTIILIVPGFLFRRLASALFFSVLGTILIFAGMILLLLFKGSTPISRIADKGLFYTAVFIAMTVFGTFEQLLLCRKTKGQSTKSTGDLMAKNQGNNKQGAEQKKRGWRTI